MVPEKVQPTLDLGNVFKGTTEGSPPQTFSGKFAIPAGPQFWVLWLSIKHLTGERYETPNNISDHDNKLNQDGSNTNISDEGSEIFLA